MRYLKKLILFFLLIVVLSACSEENKTPPELKVSSNNDEVVAVLGEYNWTYQNFDGTSTTESVDVDIPPRIVVHQTNELNTGMGSEINLDFGESPQDIRVYIWNSSEVEREIDVEDTTFKTDEKGYILYEIISTWDQGNVHYVVKIHVQ